MKKIIFGNLILILIENAQGFRYYKVEKIQNINGRNRIK